MKRLVLAILAALALALAVPALAQAPRTISYQGTLTDPAGAPVPNGPYALTVRLYDVASGGAALYTETHPAVSVVLGGFNVVVGSVTPLTVSFDKPLWLSLQVGANPELTPRIALASSPYAMGLTLPFTAQANAGGSPLLSLKNTGTGAALLTEGRLIVGSGATPGEIFVQTPGAASNVFEVNDFVFGSLYGGSMRVKDEANRNILRVDPDIGGNGAFMTMLRGDNNNGFMYDGSGSPNQDPVLSVLGSVRSTVFDMNVAGDASVSLPSSAISALEQVNEPGVARVYNNASIQVGNGVTTITSRSINVPDDGYCIVMAGGHFEYSHVAGSDSRCIFGVNDVAGVFGSQQDVVGIPAALPSGNYRMSSSSVGVWPVTPGLHTFSIMAQKVGAANGAVLNDPSITILYVPTAYGSVTTSLETGDAIRTGPGGAMSASDVAAEQREAAEFERGRVRRELDTMRAKLDALTRRLATDEQAIAAEPKR